MCAQQKRKNPSKSKAFVEKFLWKCQENWCKIASPHFPFFVSTISDFLSFFLHWWKKQKLYDDFGFLTKKKDESEICGTFRCLLRNFEFFCNSFSFCRFHSQLFIRNYYCESWNEDEFSFAFADVFFLFTIKTNEKKNEKSCEGTKENS